MNTSLLRARALLAAGLLLTSSALRLSAQATPTPAADPDKAIELSPFRVDTSKDKGYLATNAISGTRLNTPIKDLPMPIEVITGEFIQDIGANDLKESLAFSSGIYGSDNFTTESGGPGLFDFSPSRPTNKPLSQLPTAVNIRGFYTGTQLRLGFRSGTQFDATVLGAPSDPVDIDRAEVVRGPAALLYGVSTLGGVVNILPKLPLPQQRYALTANVGSFDYRRISLDATGPLLPEGKLNYRVLAAHSTTGSEVDDYELNNTFVGAKLEWRPFRNTTVYGEVLNQKTEERGLGFNGGARDIFDTNDVTHPRNRYFELLNWTRDIGGFSRRTYNLAGPDVYEDTTTTTYLVQAEQRILPDLTLVVGYQLADGEIDRLRIINQRTDTVTVAQESQFPDAATRTTYANGLVKAIRYDWDNDPFEVDSQQYRAELNYKLTLGETTHNFLLGRQSTRDEVFRPDNRPTIQNTSTNAAWTRSEFKNVTNLSPIRYDGTTFERLRDTTQTNWFDGDYLVYQAKALSNRLHTIAGARQDRFASRVLDFDYVNGVRNAAPTFPDEGPGTARPFNAPKRAGYRFGGKPQTETTYTGGANYAVTKEINVYGLVAQGLFPNPGQRNGAAQNFDAEKTLSKELGVKIDLMGGKVSGTIAYFEIGRENATYFYGNAPAPRANFAPVAAPGQNLNNFDPARPRQFAVRSQFFPAGYAGRTTNDLGVAVGSGYFLVNYETLAANATERAALEAAFRDTLTANPIDYGAAASNTPNKGRGSDVSYEEESKGFDAQLILSPLPNWQVTFNYAYIDKAVSDGFTLVDAVDLNNGVNYGTEYDAWLLELGRDNFSDPKRASTWNRTSIVGRTLDLGPKQTASFFSNYRFTDGPLRNLSARAGAIFTGKRPTTVDFGGGNTNVNSLRTPDVDARVELRAGLGYRMRWQGGDWRLNLSIDNLMDTQKNEETVVYSLGSTTAERRQVTFYRPRNIRFSASVDF
jgi:iron complex outermembrane recepter protein